VIGAIPDNEPAETGLRAAVADPVVRVASHRIDRRTSATDQLFDTRKRGG
jgi:hypothetical protein